MKINKKVLLLIFYFINIEFQISGQSSKVDSIIGIVELIKSKGSYLENNNKRDLDNYWCKAALLLDSMLFNYDSILIEYINQNEEFIKTYKDSSVVFVSSGSNGSSTFERSYWFYKESLKYIGIDSISLITQFLRDNNHVFVYKFLQNYDTANVYFLYEQLDFISRIKLLENMSSILKLKDKFNIFFSFIKFKNIIKNDSSLYVKYLYNLNRSETSKMRESILGNELYEYFTLRNSNWNLDSFLIKFSIGIDCNIASIKLDEQENIGPSSWPLKMQRYYEKQDSLLGKIDFTKVDSNIIKLIFDRYNDISMVESDRDVVEFVDVAQLPPEDRRIYELSNDTTLWDASIYQYRPDSADSGFRADTLTNAELIGELYQLNFHSINDSIGVFGYEFPNQLIIRLRKIFQILGDRNTFGSYTPSPQDTGILYAWVDKYYDAVLHSSYPAMQDEAADQILRLWRLVYPRWVGWLKNENLMTRGLIKQRIIYMLNEELILDLIARGDAVYTPESPKEAHILADPLLDVFYGVVIPEHLKSTRRPSWSAVEAQRWVDDYIVPALKRWKYFGF
ncbi:MAG: hypothetical protein IPJ83_06995 [Saprospiraceae bacterium]|nr:hypothetical protein [Candidatus Vicinibacter proximus]